MLCGARHEAVAAARSVASARLKSSALRVWRAAKTAARASSSRVESRTLLLHMRLADLDELRQLVVPLAQQRVELVPGARRFVGRSDEPVVRRDEREHEGHDGAEHEKPEQHYPEILPKTRGSRHRPRRISRLTLGRAGP